MARADELSLTIKKIYAAATDPGAWREALTAVEDFTGSTGAVVDLTPIAGARPHTFAGSFSHADCLHYATHYQAICPRIRFGRENPDVAIQYDSMIMSEHEMDQDPVYAWFGSHGLRYYVGAIAGRTARHLSYFSIQRSRRQGHADADAIAAFELVRPHLAQALALADTLDTLGAHRSFSDAMLDALPQAVFALGGDGVLLFANRAGERMLHQRDWLRSLDGRLLAAEPRAQGRLDALVRSASSGGCGGVLRLDSITGRRPCALRVAAIHPAHSAIFGQPAVLAIASGSSTAMLDEELARVLYDLTRAEARTAAALMAGHSVQSAAQILSVSPETIRSHLKALFRKVGVSRQQDLIRTFAELEMNSSADGSRSPE